MNCLRLVVIVSLLGFAMGIDRLMDIASAEDNVLKVFVLDVTKAAQILQFKFLIKLSAFSTTQLFFPHEDSPKITFTECKKKWRHCHYCR